MPFILKIKIDNQHLEDIYTLAAEKHNKMIKESKLPDSGFDLYSPVGITCDEQATSCTTHLIDLGIKAAAYEVRHFDPSQLDILDPRLCRPFKIHTRSSIYKTRWRLANNTGIIDAGYRGNLKAAMDYHRGFTNQGAELEKDKRYWQICMATLEPFSVYIVDELDKTERGEGGHGSTGK
jgi:dUTP pyrophosphatase